MVVSGWKQFFHVPRENIMDVYCTYGVRCGEQQVWVGENKIYGAGW